MGPDLLAPRAVRSSSYMFRTRKNDNEYDEDVDFQGDTPFSREAR